MQRLWNWIKHLVEGAVFGGLIITMLGDKVTSDPKWLFLAILVGGSFIADEIDEAFNENKKDRS